MRSAGGEEVLAVERAKDAAHTYFSNLIKSNLSFDQFCALPAGAQIERGLLPTSVEALIDIGWKPSKAVDVVVGGPPCQGFSLAGKRDSKDARNQLAWKFLEVVNSLNPKMVVIENVEGMNQRFADMKDENQIDETSSFAQVLLALQDTGEKYITFGLRVNAKHFGAAQHRPRLMALGIRADIAKRLELEQTNEIWSSTFASSASLPIFVPVPTVSQAATVADAIADLAAKKSAIATNEYVERVNSLFGPWGNRLAGRVPANNDRRSHRPATRLRFSVLQELAKLDANPRLLGPMSDNHRAKALEDLREKIAKSPDFRFQSGASRFTADEFLALVVQLANNKHSQRALKWAAPARTVMTIPDDHVHPSEPRTFTVREMARFQGFPDNFVFMGKITTGGSSRRLDVPQYSQVGNAVSPFVAKAIGTVVARILSDPRARVRGSDEELVVAAER